MKKILLSILIFKSVSFACCGCLLVDLSMQLLSSTMESGMQSAEEVHANSYEQQVLKKIESSLEAIRKRSSELSKVIAINKNLQANCDSELLFELEKTYSLDSLIKSQKIYESFSK